jgi:hypothetical protein
MFSYLNSVSGGSYGDHIYISVSFYKQGAPTERLILFLIPSFPLKAPPLYTYHTTRKSLLPDSVYEV